jgi:hypothetical protein
VRMGDSCIKHARDMMTSSAESVPMLAIYGPMISDHQSDALSCHCVRLTSGLSGLPDLTDLTSGLTDDEHFDMYVGMLAFVYTCV